MSGGSFGYLYLSATDATEIFRKLGDVQHIEEWLRANNRHDAANEVLLYLREMETHQRRVEAIGKRIEGVLEAVEWTASGDSNIDYVDREYYKLMGMTPP